MQWFSRSKRSHQSRNQHFEKIKRPERRARVVAPGSRGRAHDHGNGPGLAAGQVQTEPGVAANAADRPPDAVVTWVGPRAAWVWQEGRERPVEIAGDLARFLQESVAVGDQVHLLERDSSPPLLQTVLPRRSVVDRPCPGNPRRRQALAANLDLAVILAPACFPGPRLGLLDRLLTSLLPNGIQPVIWVNKADLVDVRERARLTDEVLRPYRNLGIPVLAGSAQTGEGCAALLDRLHGQSSLLIGHSGVGKSTLLNRLIPGADQWVSAERQSDGRGRHTTSSARLFHLPGGGTMIDLPGIRMFGLPSREPEYLLAGFPELAEVRAGCRFSDCHHLEEPGCAVPQALADGTISAGRYRNYRRLVTGIDPDDSDEPDEPEPSGFVCAHCHRIVAEEAPGTRQRNHCPACLHSTHLDFRPGDRAAGCGGLMEPAAVWARKGGEWALLHRCQRCGVFHSNRIAGDDNRHLLMVLAVKPLAQPPFPLDGWDTASAAADQSP